MTLRARVVIDKLQPQCAALLGSIARGEPPIVGQASAYLEVVPSVAVNRLADLILKSGEVRPGMLVEERMHGLLEVHAPSVDAVHQAVETGVAACAARVDQVIAPEIIASDVISRVHARHAHLINRARQGNLLLPGQSLYVLEVEPAPYAALAANEVEKHADVTICSFRPYGRTGNLYVAGDRSSAATTEEVCRSALG